MTSALALLLAGGPARAASEHPGRLVEAAGVRLFVETEGSGPPLVLLPAGPGLDHAYFHPHLSALSPYATVVYLDPRGCGRSESRPAGEYTLEAMAADLEAVRRDLDVERINLLAHGLGVAVALRYAERQPRRIGRLVFVGASPRPGSLLDGAEVVEGMSEAMRSAVAAARANRYLSPDGRLRERLRIVSPLLFHRLTDRSFHNAFVERITTSADVYEALAPAPGAAVAPGVGAPGDGAAEALARLKAPLLIVAGRHDPTASVAEAEAVRDAVAGSRLVVLEESGSFPFVEQPVEFLKAVKGFLTGDASVGTRGAGGGI